MMSKKTLRFLFEKTILALAATFIAVIVSLTISTIHFANIVISAPINIFIAVITASVMSMIESWLKDED